MPNPMFVDTDPLWHVAAGDLVRQTGSAPRRDPYAFTTDGYDWLDISWAWDAAASASRARVGWHGPVAINALTIAGIFVLSFLLGLARSDDFAASLVTALGVLTLVPLHLRPLHVTSVMVASWLLVLGAVTRGRLRRRWLVLLPLMSAAWVNLHGGFIAGPILVGAFVLQALAARNRDLALALIATGAAVLVAWLANPYGARIVVAAWRPLTTVANHFIAEWKPLTASPRFLLTALYATLFPVLVIRRALPLLPVERWLAYGWFLLALTSNRYLTVFAITAAGPMACALAPWLSSGELGKRLSSMKTTLAQVYGRRTVAFAALAATAGFVAWLPSASASRAFAHTALSVEEMQPEADFVVAQRPHARLFNHFNLGGFVLFHTRGALPVFIDPRTETAYPASVLHDYERFDRGAADWEELLDHWHIDTVMMPNHGDDLALDRFRVRRGWREVFRGPTATVFFRDP